MEPMTIDDLLLLLGQKEAHIAQLQRHIRSLQTEPAALTGDVVPVVPAPVPVNGER